MKYVDTFARDLHTALVARNLTEIVDIVFVSDHGMTDTSHPELLYLDDMLGEDGLAAVEHADGEFRRFLVISLYLKPYLVYRMASQGLKIRTVC